MMDRENFWRIIEESRNEAGQQNAACLMALKHRLEGLTAFELEQFQRYFDAYHALAYKAGLWEAASVIQNGCGDDDFTDFRSWLISQGKDTYSAALLSPDSLADRELPGDCELELFAYMPSWVYEQRYGQAFPCSEPGLCAQELEELRKEIPFAPGIEQKHNGFEVCTFIPNLVRKYCGEAVNFYLTGWRCLDEPLDDLTPETAQEPPVPPGKWFTEKISAILVEYNSTAMEKFLQYARELDIDGCEKEQDFFSKFCRELETAKQEYGLEIAQQIFNTGEQFTFNYFEIPDAALGFSRGLPVEQVIQYSTDGFPEELPQSQNGMEMKL